MENITLLDGSPVTPDHKEIDPLTGMQKGYIILSAEERAKGFVRPVRRSYKHVGIFGPKHSLRDLTEEEKLRYSVFNYVKFEKYSDNESPVTGKYWTQLELDSIKKGCGGVTTMGLGLAETYARQPSFYNGTFCIICKKHLPLNEFVWDGTDEQVGL
jgi:hypothetical protein